MKRNLKSKRMLLVSVLLGLVCVGLSAVDEPIGVVANLDTSCIQFIDPVSMSISEIYLNHELGYAGGLLDVVITSDGKKAVVSNFGEAKIYFIDISGGFDVVPVMKGRGHVPMFAEDLALTPDDKYVLVTDGGLSSRICVFDMATHQLLLSYTMKAGRDAQSVAVTADGKHVIVADYLGSRIHSYDFDSENVTLTYRQSRFIPYSNVTSGPVNTVI
jgi:DNA-binding beta-propeller fold protein YncE